MIKASIHITGIIGNGEGQFSLKNVISQFKAFENPTEAEFIIDSVGGSVEVGESIGKYIENLQIPTTTIAVKAYSIAAHIFMSGQTRLVEDTAKPLMIHLPLIPEFGGRSNDFQAAADYLKGEEKKFTDFYSSKLDLDKDTIYALLSQETFLSGQEAIEMGFATGIRTQDFKAVAFHDPKQPETKNMTKETFLTKLANALGFETEQKPEPVALVLQDANGVEIDFTELAEGDTPEVGAKAEIDGKPAEGEHVSPDGSKWVFEGGELKEIIPAESEEEEEEDAPAEDSPVVAKEEEIDIDALIEKIVNGTAAKMQDKLDAQAIELKKLIGSKEIEVSTQETNSKTQTKSKNYLR